LIVRKDAWCIGRVVISNATEIGERALVLNESNVLHNIPADTTWAGNPAKDVTDKLGRQFEELSDDEKALRLYAEIRRFENRTGYFGFLSSRSCEAKFGTDPRVTYFSVSERTYTKRRTAAEVAFMRFTSGKFVPIEGS
jgi:hypothetical protein